LQVIHHDAELLSEPDLAGQRSRIVSLADQIGNPQRAEHTGKHERHQ
jgi:hypothetical protein